MRQNYRTTEPISIPQNWIKLGELTAGETTKASVVRFAPYRLGLHPGLQMLTGPMPRPWTNTITVISPDEFSEGRTRVIPIWPVYAPSRQFFVPSRYILDAAYRPMGTYGLDLPESDAWLPEYTAAFSEILVPGGSAVIYAHGGGVSEAYRSIHGMEFEILPIEDLGRSHYICHPRDAFVCYAPFSDPANVTIVRDFPFEMGNRVRVDYCQVQEDPGHPGDWERATATAKAQVFYTPPSEVVWPQLNFSDWDIPEWLTIDRISQMMVVLHYTATLRTFLWVTLQTYPDYLMHAPWASGHGGISFTLMRARPEDPFRDAHYSAWSAHVVDLPSPRDPSEDVRWFGDDLSKLKDWNLSVWFGNSVYSQPEEGEEWILEVHDAYIVFLFRREALGTVIVETAESSPPMEDEFDGFISLTGSLRISPSPIERLSAECPPVQPGELPTHGEPVSWDCFLALESVPGGRDVATVNYSALAAAEGELLGYSCGIDPESTAQGLCSALRGEGGQIVVRVDISEEAQVGQVLLVKLILRFASGNEHVRRLAVTVVEPSAPPPPALPGYTLIS